MHFGFQFHVDFEPHVGLLSAQVYTINRGMKVNDKYAPIYRMVMLMLTMKYANFNIFAIQLCLFIYEGTIAMMQS